MTSYERQEIKKLRKTPLTYEVRDRYRKGCDTDYYEMYHLAGGFEGDLGQLRGAFSEILEACGNASGRSQPYSVEFMCAIPAEVRRAVKALKFKCSVYRRMAADLERCATILVNCDELPPMVLETREEIVRISKTYDEYYEHDEDNDEYK